MNSYIENLTKEKNKILSNFLILQRTNEFLYNKFETDQQNRTEKLNIKNDLIKELEEIVDKN